MLRRYIARTPVQFARDLTNREAATLLGRAHGAINHGRKAVKTWRAADLIDYQHRRHSMATWTINSDVWHTVTTGASVGEGPSYR
ncbi:hypothetical protein [Dactylosporangium darangshiense]